MRKILVTLTALILVGCDAPLDIEHTRYTLDNACKHNEGVHQFNVHRTTVWTGISSAVCMDGVIMDIPRNWDEFNENN